MSLKNTKTMRAYFKYILGNYEYEISYNGFIVTYEKYINFEA